MCKKVISYNKYISTYDINFVVVKYAKKKILGTFIQLDIFHKLNRYFVNKLSFCCISINISYIYYIYSNIIYIYI